MAAILKIEKMQDGYYIVTYNYNGVTFQRVLADPKEKVNIKQLKPIKETNFNILIEAN